jgi:hypothetical protein
MSTEQHRRSTGLSSQELLEYCKIVLVNSKLLIILSFSEVQEEFEIVRGIDFLYTLISKTAVWMDSKHTDPVMHRNRQFQFVYSSAICGSRTSGLHSISGDS